METAQARPAGTLDADEPRAPPLPIEGPLVAATRALDAARSGAERALLLLEWSPRDEAQVFETLAALNTSASTAWNAYATYSEIRKCQGQA